MIGQKAAVTIVSVSRSTRASAFRQPGSHGEFIIEHYWGYTKRSGTRVDEYKVEHPKWELFSVKNEVIDVDFGATYGDEFAFLGDAKPYSVLLAKGSEIAVYKGEQISV